MRRFALALLLASLPLGGTLLGQSAPILPGDLETVATGGYWDTGRQSGQYRVVITVGGYEEIESQVYLQWLFDAGSESDTTEVVASVPVKELNDSVFHYGHVRFNYHAGTTTITLDGVNIDTPSHKHTEWVITASRPGVYTVSGTGLHADPPPE